MLIWLPVALFIVGAAAIFLGAVGGRRRRGDDDFVIQSTQRRGVYDLIQRRLRRSGLPQTSPGLFLMVVIGSMLAVYIAALIYTGSFFVPLFLVPIPLALIWGYLVWRERNFVSRASREIVPMLRRIQSSVSAGRNAQAAMVEALRESPLLGTILEPVVQRLELNAPFQETLQMSTELLPLRTWEQFVRQMEMHFESGGDLGEILNDTVEQINSSIQLQAELRADYGRIAKQQYILIAIAIGVIPFMHFVMGGLIGPLFDSLMGIAAFCGCILLMLAGVIFGQLQVRDVEKKLDF